MEKDKVIKKSDCPHVGEINTTKSEKNTCDVCDINEHLRLCTSCGAVHCCESGKGHDTEHYQKTGHPIIVPVLANYDFTWCYECKSYLKE